jgi:hypothetical protein
MLAIESHHSMVAYLVSAPIVPQVVSERIFHQFYMYSKSYSNFKDVEEVLGLCEAVANMIPLCNPWISKQNDALN